MIRRALSGLFDRWPTGSDAERLSAAIVLLGSLLALTTLFLGGFFEPSGTLSELLYALSLWFPVIGGLLAVTAIGLWVWGPDKRAGRPGPLVDGYPPECGSISSERSIYERDTIETAATRRYRTMRRHDGEDIREQLADGAMRVLVTKGGFQAATVRDAIRSGTWTDDPVAAAFLSPAVPLPVTERLREAIDPGAAYTHRVRRTLSAIERIGSTELAEPGRGDEPDAETTEHPQEVAR